MPRAKSDPGASLQFDRRPVAFHMLPERRLEANRVRFSGYFLHLLTD